MPRLAVRALILDPDNRLLVVNAWRGKTHLWCAPGGGVEPHDSLHDTLRREVREECGLDVTVGALCLVNEFHDPARGFHQVDIYFRCTPRSAACPEDWTDPAGVVSHRRWVTRDELAQLRVKPDSLAAVAWDDSHAPDYDPLELIVR